VVLRMNIGDLVRADGEPAHEDGPGCASAKDQSVMQRIVEVLAEELKACENQSCNCQAEQQSDGDAFVAAAQLASAGCLPTLLPVCSGALG
jgi:hypothetical protein